MANFENLYNEVIKKSLVEKFGYTNPHEIPKLTKIVLNIGVGDAVTDKKKLNNAVDELALISGQKPVVTKARKSIATFKLREGMPIGCKVTLRSTRMNSLKDLSIWLCRALETSTVLLVRTLTVKVTLLLVLKNRLFSLKSTMIRLKTSEVWTSASAPAQRLMKKLRLFSLALTFLTRNRWRFYYGKNKFSLQKLEKS